jgi:hypothetical protein
MTSKLAADLSWRRGDKARFSLVLNAICSSKSSIPKSVNGSYEN